MDDDSLRICCAVLATSAANSDVVVVKLASLYATRTPHNTRFTSREIVFTGRKYGYCVMNIETHARVTRVGFLPRIIVSDTQEG